jgi:hypothetical protein
MNDAWNIYRTRLRPIYLSKRTSLARCRFLVMRTITQHDRSMAAIVRRITYWALAIELELNRRMKHRFKVARPSLTKRRSFRRQRSSTSG